jgi:uncharacterized protein (DUF1800 family)
VSRFCAFVLAAAVVACGCSGNGRGTPSSASSLSTKSPPSVVIPPNRWPDEKKARHALNRLAYGPSPGDVEAVAREGVAVWIRAQMAPDSLPDPDTDAEVASLKTLRMSIAALQVEFPRPAVAAARARAEKGAAGDRMEPIPPGKRPAVMQRELVSAKLVRAVDSSRQLQEVLTDFWFNHFNVYLGKSEDRWMIGPYERDAIRPHVFGGFRQLLGATAKHPAMLWYLDNWMSTRGGPRGGINENYARELLELHTLGVDGGYTQEDVREVARCFTGWSIVRPRGKMAAAKGAMDPAEAGTFVFRDLAHDRGAKRVLGEFIPAGGGMSDGEKVLDLLVEKPATARFVALKLCRKFVADVPPPALVERVADTFRRTRGDLPSVYAAIFSSPEFWSDSAFASKTKTPLELAASGVRALGGRVRAVSAPALARQIARMGEPLYECPAPTGYKETADAWVNTGSLLNRLNFALALASGKIPGVGGDPARLAPGSPEPARLAGLALGSPEFQRR